MLREVKLALLEADVNYKIVKEFSKIDILINNAAYTCDNPIYEKTKNEFMIVLEVNVFGTFLVSKYVSNYMKEGTIINISSTDAVDTYNQYNIDYSASKAAINSLTKSLSLALPNIKVIAIMPPFVNTEIVRTMDKEYLKSELKRINQKRLLEPYEVANKLIEIIKSDIKTVSIIRIE